jgi:chromosome partitioning protein
MRERRSKERGAARVKAPVRLVVALANEKGGVGKTTLAINLAIAGQRRGLVASLLDLDPQKSAERFADLRAELTGEEAPVVVHGAADNLKQMVETARECGTDLVLIDTPGALDRTLLLAATLGDVIVVPTRTSVLDQAALRDTLDYLEMAGKLGKCLVVLNALRSGKEDEGGTAVRAIAAGFGVPVAAVAIEDQPVFSASLALGKAVVESRRNKAARSVDLLLDEVIARYEAAAAGTVRRAR